MFACRHFVTAQLITSIVGQLNAGLTIPVITKELLTVRVTAGFEHIGVIEENCNCRFKMTMMRVGW